MSEELSLLELRNLEGVRAWRLKYERRVAYVAHDACSPIERYCHLIWYRMRRRAAMEWLHAPEALRVKRWPGVTYIHRQRGR